MDKVTYRKITWYTGIGLGFVLLVISFYYSLVIEPQMLTDAQELYNTGQYTKAIDLFEKAESIDRKWNRYVTIRKGRYSSIIEGSIVASKNEQRQYTGGDMVIVYPDEPYVNEIDNTIIQYKFAHDLDKVHPISDERGKDKRAMSRIAVTDTKQKEEIVTFIKTIPHLLEVKTYPIQ